MSASRVAIVIPARYASTRLPGKMLLRSTGKYLVQHVYEQALRARSADDVVVATDDTRIEAAVRSFGGRCVMTRPDHASGTDRIAEVARQLPADVFVNLQGDEPEIDPACLDVLPGLLARHAGADVATLATPISDVASWRNPNCVKVVCDDTGRALYFSRAPIPHVRDGEPDFASGRFLQHIGLYAYRREFLLRLAEHPATELERTEKLEQLRVLEMGRAIQVGVVRHAGRGVDTLDDYERFRQARAA